MLIGKNLLEDVKKIVMKITKEKGIWLDALKGVGDWLYYNRKDASEQLSKKVRDLYEDLMPEDLIQKALLFTKFWQPQ